MFSSFPDPELHTDAEALECIRIRTKIARYTVQLIDDAEGAGKLPSPREFLARAMELELAAAFRA